MRNKTNLLVVPGWHSVLNLLKPDALMTIDHILVSQTVGKDKIRQLDTHTYELVEKSVLDKLSDHHQGVVAMAVPKSFLLEDIRQPLLDHNGLVIVLDEVQDPHNLGACMRLAAASGACAVIIPKRNSVGYTPVVQKVASGATAVVPMITVANITRALQTLQGWGVWSYGFSEHTDDSLYDAKLNETPVAMVFGSEGNGIRRLTRETCDHLLTIPTQPALPSLNIATACAVGVFEWVRQRGLE